MAIPNVHSLIRCDNNLWSYTPKKDPAIDARVQQFQIQTPYWNAPGLNYNLTQAIVQAFDSLKITSGEQLKNGLLLDLANVDSPLCGRWKISVQTNDSLFDRIWQFFPFTRTYYNPNICLITCTKHDSIFAKISDFVHTLFFAKADVFVCSNPLPTVETTFQVPTNRTLNEQLSQNTFTDAFTQAATLYHQSIDPYFVFEQQVLSGFRFVLADDRMLSLQKITNAAPTLSEQIENRQTATYYRDFIVAEFGLEMLEYVNSAYGFSLDDIIRLGLPLVPDHVFKVNIGMNNIELAHIQKAYDGLQTLHTDLTSSQNLETAVAKLPKKHVRALVQHVRSKFSTSELIPSKELVVRFLKEILPPPGTSVKTMPADVFNLLISLVMPTSLERERAYTGRKITHLAIQGPSTMGDQNIFCPARDLFDLLQLFDEMQKVPNYDEYHRLLTHVVVKKNLYRKTAPELMQPGIQRHWHVGFLIPGPTGDGNVPTWFYNDSFFDDNDGNVNCVFLPACESFRYNGKMLPFIKAYRSTSAYLGTIDGWESVVADLNPYGPPGSLDPASSFNQEKHAFYKRTIPLWVGYLLQAQKAQAADVKQQAYSKALNEYSICINAPGKTPQWVYQRVEDLLKSQDALSVDQFLTSEAQKHREFTDEKISQDIVCAGHSLGASLAQFAIYYYCIRERRIPLPGNNLICFSSRGPAIQNYQDQIFMQFGKENSALIQALGQRWYIRQDMEYGDFVPESGQSHLGTTGYTDDVDNLWLQQNITLFQPQDTAESLDITTLSTHNRRTGNALVGRDFTTQNLTVSDLVHFDHDWWMSKKLIQLFGYRILRSSKVTEGARETASVLTRPIVEVAMDIFNCLVLPIMRRGNRGFITLRYHQPPVTT